MNARLFTAVAIFWSLFQLAVAQVVLLDSVVVRSVHLACAMALVYLSRQDRLSLILALLGGLAALYLIADYEGLATRQGRPLTRDLFAGALLICVLLEAGRRCLGRALPIVASLFILSALFASDLPSFLASRDVSISHLLGKLTMSTEGIYGIPLRVSADTVFLFVLFGSMLEKAGGGQFFVDLALALLGRYRGGPAKAAVVASGLTGLVSGSSIANTVTTGTFTIPLMKRSGYPAWKAAAIEVAASTNGQLMPPIMGAAAFIIAEYCNIPYIEVVRAAIIPALVSYLALLYITHLEALKLNIAPVAESEIPSASKVLREGAHFLIPLLALGWELLVMRHTPRLSAFNAIWILAIIMLIQQAWQGSLRKGLRLLWESLESGAGNMMDIGVAVACAGIIVGVVSMGLGGKITEVIDVLSGGMLYPLLGVTAIVSLILGMGLPTTANYIIMANLTAPAILTLSADAGLAVPLVAAHLFCFYFGILADDTPPVGLAAYAAAAIAKAPAIATGLQGFLYDMRTAILPFMFLLNTELLLIGVDSWSYGFVVFAMALLGMLAFASLTQHYMLCRNKVWESMLLAVSTLLLLRPYVLATAPWPGYALGALCVLTVYLLQRSRCEPEATPC